MEIAIVSLLSASLVALIGQIGGYISDRKKHREGKEDKKDEVMKSLENLTCKVTDIYDKIDSLEARQARVRILRFDDDLLHGHEFTHDHWRQILDDVDIYEGFCDAHPDFKNGVAKHAMQHIKTMYDFINEKGGFLV